MVAGKLRQRILIQRAAETTDEYGQTIRIWSATREVWAMLRFTSGDEKTEARRVQGVRSGTATIRYLEDVTEKDRLMFKNRVFRIVSVVSIDRHAGETVLQFEEAV